eukprot:2416127-Ditylum_brightwellii.AAC.1
MKFARRSGREQLMVKKDKPKLSRIARNLNIVRKKFGIKISKNTKKALLLDKVNGDKKWVKAILKEMDTLDD